MTTSFPTWSTQPTCYVIREEEVAFVSPYVLAALKNAKLQLLDEIREQTAHNCLAER